MAGGLERAALRHRSRHLAVASPRSTSSAATWSRTACSPCSRRKTEAQESEFRAHFINLSYIVASVLFIFGLKMLSSPTTARAATWCPPGHADRGRRHAAQRRHEFRWIIVGVIIGSIIGALAARLVKMTAMPEMVALFNGFGGIASLLVGWAEFHASPTADLHAVAIAWRS
jgi:urea transporter